MNDDLEKLIPHTRTLTVGGQALKISPLVIGELPAMLSAAKKIAPEFLKDEVDLLALFAEHGGLVLEMLSMATRKPPEFIDALPIDEALELFKAVFEVNTDFFIHRVEPAIKRLKAVAPVSDGSMPPPA